MIEEKKSSIRNHFLTLSFFLSPSPSLFLLSLLKYDYASRATHRNNSRIFDFGSYISDLCQLQLSCKPWSKVAQKLKYTHVVFKDAK